MKHQDYRNHRKVVPILNFFFAPLGMVTFGVAFWHFFSSLNRNESMLVPALFLVFGIYALIALPLARSFALKAQDRAIRAEENLRHYVLTGELLPPAVTLRQTIALRFASDEEFPALVKQAVEQQMKPDDIKRAIKNWRADHHRV